MSRDLVKNSKTPPRMKINKMKMRKIRFGSKGKSQVRTQFGALCYRVKNDKIQILLITSRTTRRWIVPKGWPVDKATPYEAALTEAWEEAGVKGKIKGNTVGIYSYVKRDDRTKSPCVVVVFAVKVRKLSNTYPEVQQRRRKWVSRKKAAKMVDEPELKQLLRSFDPATL